MSVLYRWLIGQVVKFFVFVVIIMLGNVAHGTSVSSTPIYTEKGTLGYATAAVSLSSVPTSSSSSCTSVSSDTLTVSGLPAGATVRRAILYWASAHSDNQVTLEGNNIPAEQTWDDRLTVGGASQDYYGYRAEVTNIVTGNGAYSLADLSSPASVTFGGACLGGAMLAVIYDTLETDPNRVNRIDIFDGFEGIRGSPGATGGQFSEVSLSTNLTSSQFSSVSTMSWQGNAVSESSQYSDTLTINGTAISGANNPVNDANNGSGAGGAPSSQYGVDFDTFDVSPQASGATGLTIRNRSNGWDYVIIQGFVISSRGAETSDAPVATYGLASHEAVTTLRMGALIDHEVLDTSYAGDADALGDDNDFKDDDDGVIIPTLPQGSTAIITTTVEGAGGYLQGWIDFNGNGVFDANEQVATDLQDGGALDTDATAGTIAFKVEIPADATTTKTFARFRWSTTAGLDSITPANDGEVEDYAITIEPQTQTVEPMAIDACEASGGVQGTNNLFTILDNGTFGFEDGGAGQSPASDPYPGVLSGGTYAQYEARVNDADSAPPFHGEYSYVANIVRARNNYQHELASDPVYGGTGRFFASDPDEVAPEMTLTLTNLQPNHFYSYSFWAASSEPTGNQNEVDVFINGVKAYDTGSLPTVVDGVAWKQYGFTFTNGNSNTITISMKSVKEGTSGYDFYLDNVTLYDCNIPLDFSDAPANGSVAPNGVDNTAYGEALHTIDSTIQLGATITSETSAVVDADDASDDGITIPTLEQNQSVTIEAVVSGAGGYLQGWIDWDGNGVFDVGEQVATDLQDDGTGGDTAGDGTITFEVTPPVDATTNQTFARFRWSTTAALDSTTNADNGEVEDYAITVLPERDSDGDGVPDSTDLCAGYPDSNDFDRDGVPDGCDLDDDNDGILDINELSCSRAGLGTLSPDSATHSNSTANSFKSPRELSKTYDNNLGTFGGSEVSTVEVDGLSLSATYSYINVLSSVTELHIYNNGGDQLSDAGAIGSIGNLTFFGDGGSVLYSQDDVPVTNNGSVFILTLPSDLVGVRGFSMTDMTTTPGGKEVVWRDVYLKGIPCVGIDTDGDGQPDDRDLDSDNDGLSDLMESYEADTATALSVDTNNDGMYDSTTFSSTNAGVVITANGGNGVIAPDTDGDGINNVLDLDADGDGIQDAIEGQSTANYPAGFYTGAVDADGDGVLSIFDANDAVAGSIGGTFNIPEDTDGTGVPDYLDLDSDDDGESDTLEAYDMNGNGVIDGAELTVTSAADADEDGLDNVFDTDGTSTTNAARAGDGESPLADFPTTDDTSAMEVNFRYVIVGYPVSGQVYIDANSSTLKEAGEAGIGGTVVILRDKAAGICRSTSTNASGDYQFSSVLDGDYEIYQAHGETTPVPQSCSNTLAKNPVGYQSTTPDILDVTVAEAEVTGQDFGEVAGITFEPNNQGEVLPGNTTMYAHVLASEADGGVRFTAVDSGNTSDGWTYTLYRDTDCSGTLNGTEGNAAISGMNFGIAAGARLCIINKVYAPATVPAQDRYKVDITATFTYPSPTTLPVTLAVNDLTIAVQTGGPSLALTKTVENLNQLTGETDTFNEALPGDVLKYRIYYHNDGTGPVNDLHINDMVPEFTLLNPGTATCDEVPVGAGGLSCTAVVNGDALEWQFGGILLGGEYGFVSYAVTVE